MNHERVVSVTLGRAVGQHKDRSLEDLKKLTEIELGERLPAGKIKISGINRAALERNDLTMETKEQAEAARENPEWVSWVGKGVKVRSAHSTQLQ
jgi:hypothetical protein